MTTWNVLLAIRSILNRYDRTQRRLACITLLVFLFGCILLIVAASHTSTVTSVQGNLEAPLAAFGGAPEALVWAAVPMLLMPLLGMWTAAARMRRAAQVYAVLAVFLLIGLVCGGIVPIRWLILGEGMCDDLFDSCFACDSSERPVKCHVQAGLALKDCFYYSDAFELVCSDLKAGAATVVVFLVLAVVMAGVNVLLAMRLLHSPIAFVQVGVAPKRLRPETNEEEHVKTLKLDRNQIDRLTQREEGIPTVFFEQL